MSSFAAIDELEAEIGPPSSQGIAGGRSPIPYVVLYILTVIIILGFILYVMLFINDEENATYTLSFGLIATSFAILFGVSLINYLIR